jgi:hypothetical protein
VATTKGSKRKPFLPRSLAARGLRRVRVVLLSTRLDRVLNLNASYYHVSGRTGFTSPEFGSDLETTDSGVAASTSPEQLLATTLLACMLKMERERGKEISSKAFRDCVIISTCKDRISHCKKSLFNPPFVWCMYCHVMPCYLILLLSCRSANTPLVKCQLLSERAGEQ